MISNTLVQTINSCSKIALAVSGGSDSMAMLHWFASNVDKSKFYVINVEHGIRGEESLRDSKFVKDYCNNNGVVCLCKSVCATDYANQNKIPLEQAARLLRHEIFKQEAITTADYIALAHHKNDQAESIFMHIARGSGINGLRGMSEIDGYILRPLLNVDKCDIMEYIQLNSVPYMHDSTNSDNSFNRNYTRNVILPTIQKVYPQFINNLVKLGAKASETMDYICAQLPQLEVINNCCAIDIASLPMAVAKVTVQRAAAMVGAPMDIEEKHINACLELVYQTNGARLKLPHGLTAYNENGMLALTGNFDTDNSTYKFSFGEFNFLYGDYLIYLTGNSSDIKSLADLDKIPDCAVIRTMKKGDKIKLSFGTKSLGDYFTDKKIPKRLRGCIPIIADGSSVIAVADWAVGIDYAPNDKTTKHIAINYLEKDKFYE